MITLGLETSSKTAGVALVRDGVVLSSETVFTRLTHSQIIMPMVEHALKNAEISFDEVDRIAVSAGPGSYTGLRIGIAAAKGMCQKNNIPAAGVSTLKALAARLLPYNGSIMSVMRARDNIAYFAAYESDGVKLSERFADRVTPLDDIKKIRQELSYPTVLVGDWAEYVKSALFLDDDSVFTAPSDKLLQDPVSVIAAAHDSDYKPADELSAYYLQITKAQKLREQAKN